MNLNELEKLADAALILDHNEQEGWYEPIYIQEQGAYYQKNAELISACDPQTVKQLIALCKLQHDVISKCMDYQDACTPDGYAEHTTNMRSGKSMDWTKMRSAQRAFNQFEEFNK